MNQCFISTIRNEEERFKGISFKYGPFDNIEKAMQIAENFASDGYLYTEISDNQNNIIEEYEN
jgi:hypothetical protein